MASSVQYILRAIIAEVGQRYAMACLLDEIRRDPRLLEDLGLSYEWLKNAIEQDQQENSPLRALPRFQIGAFFKRTLQ